MGGSYIRPESTGVCMCCTRPALNTSLCLRLTICVGYGTVYFGEECLKEKNDTFKVHSRKAVHKEADLMDAPLSCIGQAMIGPRLDSSSLQQLVLVATASVHSVPVLSVGQEGGCQRLWQCVHLCNREAAGLGRHPCDCL